MKPVIDQLLQEATILGMLDEAPFIRPGKAPQKDVEVVDYKTKKGDMAKMQVPVALRQDPDHPARIAAERLRKDKGNTGGKGGKEVGVKSATDGQIDTSKISALVGDDPPKKKGAESSKKKGAELTPATKPKSPEEIEKFRSKMFKEPGQSSSWTGDEQSTPKGNPPSDAEARTISSMVLVLHL